MMNPTQQSAFSNCQNYKLQWDGKFVEWAVMDNTKALPAGKRSETCRPGPFHETAPNNGTLKWKKKR